MFEHRIQDHQQFPHAGRQGDLLGLASRTAALRARTDHGIDAYGDHRGPVPRRPDLGATAPDRAFPAPRPAGTIQRGHSDQRGNLLPGQRAEFGQLRQQRGGQHGSHPWDAPQQVVVLSPHRTLMNGVSTVAVCLRHFALEPGDVGTQALAHRRAGRPKPVLLCREPLDALPAACQNRRQRLSLLIGQGPRLRSHDLSEVCQRLGVQHIGLGQLSRRIRKVPTCRGLTPTTGTPAAANAPASGISIPPVASNTTRAGETVLRRSITGANPASSLGAANRPSGRKARSNGFFETSMPTKTGVLVIRSSLVAQPCMIRAQRPTQLFGLGQEGHDDPGCPTVSADLGSVGLSCPG
jgi:hypothetical protein